jgi:hypothetical protein
MKKVIKSVFKYINTIKVALLYENSKLSSGRLMVHFIFLMLNVFWISTFWINVEVPSSMENIFYALLAYVFGTKGVTIARTTVATKAAQVAQPKPEQKTANVDSPD